VAILQDEADVTQAQADLSGATLAAPASGVVAQVGFTAGQPASSQSGVIIVGSGAVDVSVDVPLADMALVKTGLRAEVTPAGATTPVAGSVTEVDLLPASSGAPTPSYPATIVVPDPPASMPTGSTATVSIEVASVPSALRVPVSALAGVTAQAGTVTTISAGKSTTVPVTIGAVGGGWAQVVSGLGSGDRVVLADANAALPSNSTAGLRGIGGGFGAGGGIVRRTTTGTPSGG
jgi:multidrug efflux pump subunit AcrA (membrane-fusion protein)